MTNEPPKTINTNHKSPLTTVIAPTFGGTTATAGDLPEPGLPEAEMPELGLLEAEIPELGLLDSWLILEPPRLLVLEFQEPRRKVGDVLAGGKVDDVLAEWKVDDVLEGGKVDDVLAEWKVDDVLEGGKLDDVPHRRKVERSELVVCASPVLVALELV